MVVTRDTTIGEVLAADMETARYFMEIGMHCVGCPSSSGESIAEACMGHGVSEDDLLSKLNEHFQSKSQSSVKRRAGRRTVPACSFSSV